MSLGEFDLIARYFTRRAARSDLLLGVGDDAAVVSVPPDRRLVVANRDVFRPFQQRRGNRPGTDDVFKRHLTVRTGTDEIHIVRFLGQSLDDGRQVGERADVDAGCRRHGDQCLRPVRRREQNRAIADGSGIVFQRAVAELKPVDLHAAPLAALLQERARMAGKRIALILSGGNIDRDLYAQVLREE